jgi:hypothetical protein
LTTEWDQQNFEKTCMMAQYPLKHGIVKLLW